MIFCGLNSVSTFFSCSGFTSALAGRLLGKGCFLVGLIGTGLASSYGFANTGFGGGAVSLMSSVIMLAARVGLVDGFVVGCRCAEEGGEGDSFWPHACRSGEGIAGAVGFRPAVRRRGAAIGAEAVTFNRGAGNCCCCCCCCVAVDEGDGERALPFGKGMDDKDEVEDEDGPATALFTSGADADPFS